MENNVVYEKNIFEIIGAAYINILDYTHQIDFLVAMQDTLRDGIHEMFIGMDYTGAGM